MKSKEGNEYELHWITTYPCNFKFHYLRPNPSEIDIRDIAHALSLTCRFGGHCRTFYSVAEHSIRVALELPEWAKLFGLLHDAHEAYLHDVPSPIKRDIQGYREIADIVQNAIECRYGLDRSDQSTGTHETDLILRATEARDLNVDMTDWEKLPDPLSNTIYPWPWQLAEERFLYYFKAWWKHG